MSIEDDISIQHLVRHDVECDDRVRTIRKLIQDQSLFGDQLNNSDQDTGSIVDTKSDLLSILECCITVAVHTFANTRYRCFHNRDSGARWFIRRIEVLTDNSGCSICIGTDQFILSTVMSEERKFVVDHQTCQTDDRPCIVRDRNRRIIQHVDIVPVGENTIRLSIFCHHDRRRNHRDFVRLRIHCGNGIELVVKTFRIIDDLRAHLWYDLTGSGRIGSVDIRIIDPAQRIDTRLVFPVD